MNNVVYFNGESELVSLIKKAENSGKLSHTFGYISVLCDKALQRKKTKDIHIKDFLNIDDDKNIKKISSFNIGTSYNKSYIKRQDQRVKDIDKTDSYKQKRESYYKAVENSKILQYNTKKQKYYLKCYIPENSVKPKITYLDSEKLNILENEKLKPFTEKKKYKAKTENGKQVKAIKERTPKLENIIKISINGVTYINKNREYLINLLND